MSGLSLLDDSFDFGLPSYDEMDPPLETDRHADLGRIIDAVSSSAGLVKKAENPNNDDVESPVEDLKK